MRSKTLGINVRVTPEEKEKLLKNADYCSLSLSEYLRRLGLGMNVEATVREKDYRLFRQLKQLRAAIPQLDKDEIIRCIDAILKELQMCIRDRTRGWLTVFHTDIQAQGVIGQPVAPQIGRASCRERV